MLVDKDTVVKAMSLDTKGIAVALKAGGYTGASFKEANFLGLNEARQFCYSVTYYDESGTGEAQGKVYVEIATVDGRQVLTADY